MRILIVDEDADVRRTLAMVFKESHEIRSCKDGEQALKELAASKFDVVFADQVMSAVGGVEFIAKAAAASPKIAVVPPTDADTLERAVEILRQGAQEQAGEAVVFVDLKHRLIRIQELRVSPKVRVSRLRLACPTSEKPSNVISITSAAPRTVASQLGQRGLTEIVEELESRLVLEAMERTGNNQIRAAAILRITRGALQYKLKKYVKPLAA